jgi:hypothetical protein
MAFYLNFESPTQKRSFKIKEMSLRQFKELNKYILNNNNIFIEKYLDEILLENLENKNDLYYFTNYDKFCCFVMLRCVCISPDLDLFSNKTNIKVNLVDFLSKILNFNFSFEKNITLLPFKINLSLPRTFTFYNFLNLSDHMINLIEVEDETIYFASLNNNEKEQILRSLPASILSYIEDYFKELNTQFTDISLNIPTINEPIPLNLFDSSMLEVLKILFKTNLNNLYELQYILTSKLNYSPEYLDNSTFIENLIILKLYEAELKKQEELSKKSSSGKVPLGASTKSL